MSNYTIKIDCPFCYERTEGQALYDYFEAHEYAIKCGQCFTVWRKAETEVIHAPSKNQRCWKEVSDD